MVTVTKLYLLLTVLIVVAGQGDNGGCPRGYTNHYESCYKLFPLEATWPEAVVFCKTFGAKLAMITDQTEQDYIKAYISGLNNSHLTQDIWLGGTDLLVQQEWIWTSTGQKIGYSYWKPGEPNNYGSGPSATEDCLALMSGAGFMWNDAPCTYRMNFLCEIELGTNPIG